MESVSSPQVKTGPFAEHSNSLYGISGVAEWTKVNSGLIKMYKAEVLLGVVLYSIKKAFVWLLWSVVGVLYWLMSSCMFVGFIVVTTTLLCHSVCTWLQYASATGTGQVPCYPALLVWKNLVIITSTTATINYSF